MVARFSHTFLTLNSRTSVAYLSISAHKQSNTIMPNDLIDIP